MGFLSDLSSEEFNTAKAGTIISVVIILGGLAIVAYQLYAGKNVTQAGSLLATIIVVGAILLLVISGQGRKLNALKEFAQQNALEYHKKLFKPKVLGRYEGKEVEVFYHFGGENDPKYTVYSAKTMREGPAFNITTENFLTKLVKRLGAKELEIGIQEFDDSFKIGGESIELLREALTTEIQQKLKAIKESKKFHGLVYKNKKVSLNVLGIEQDNQKLKEMLELATLIAKKIDGEE